LKKVTFVAPSTVSFPDAHVNEAPRFQRHAAVAVAPERLAPRVRRRREGAVGIAARHPIPGRDVRAAGVVDEDTVGERLAWIDDGIERLVVHHHARGRVLRRIAVLGDDERHRLADVAHAIGGERPLQIALEAGKRGEPDGNRRGDGAEIGRGQHEDDARRSHRRRRVDAGKARVGDGAADDDGVTEIREHDVGDVAAAAREEPEILAAAHGRAHETPAGR